MSTHRRQIAINTTAYDAVYLALVRGGVRFGQAHLKMTATNSSEDNRLTQRQWPECGGQFKEVW